tara:strand:+ start:702 stop:1019 length:318 start_codon:yes stop_codon:yes gene_type:complete
MTVNVNYPLPTVHLNGTGKKRLLKDAEKLHSVLHDTHESVSDVLQDCEFHGRDYYVQDGQYLLGNGVSQTGSTFQLAVKERQKHIKNLIAFRQYALEQLMHIRSQ